MFYKFSYYVFVFNHVILFPQYYVLHIAFFRSLYDYVSRKKVVIRLQKAIYVNIKLPLPIFI